VSNDPPLGDGWGHWVPQKPFQEYIAKYGYQEEVSSATAQDRISSNITLDSPTCATPPYVPSIMQTRSRLSDTNLQE
jgi:hypothetical protein